MEAFMSGGGGPNYPTAKTAGDSMYGNQKTFSVALSKNTGKRYYVVASATDYYSLSDFYIGSKVFYVDKNNTVTELCSLGTLSPYCNATDTTVTVALYMDHLARLMAEIIPLDE